MRASASARGERDRVTPGGGQRTRGALASLDRGASMRYKMNRRLSFSGAAMPETMTLADILTRLTREGELNEKLPDQRLRCYACGHRCVIPEGRQGGPQGPVQQGRRLYVPAGYVGVLQCDPVEKKPFFHALPGSLALSFGMLGCDYHCGYCFDGDVRVPTTKGMVTIQRLFDESPLKTEFGDAIVGTGIEGLTYGSDGSYRRIAKTFRHRYRGPLLTIKPKYLPAFRCTPEHPYPRCAWGPTQKATDPPDLRRGQGFEPAALAMRSKALCLFQGCRARRTRADRTSGQVVSHSAEDTQGDPRNGAGSHPARDVLTCHRRAPRQGPVTHPSFAFKGQERDMGSGRL